MACIDREAGENLSSAELYANEERCLLSGNQRLLSRKAAGGEINISKATQGWTAKSGQATPLLRLRRLRYNGQTTVKLPHLGQLACRDKISQSVNNAACMSH